VGFFIYYRVTLRESFSLPEPQVPPVETFGGDFSVQLPHFLETVSPIFGSTVSGLVWPAAWFSLCFVLASS
jgi:hypothetical protein